jgi:flagellar motor switch protein FliN/FliY
MMTEDEIRQFLSGLDREDVSKVKKVQFPVLAAGNESGVRIGLDYFEDIQVEVLAELGEVSMTIRDFLGLGEGAIIELDRAAGETVDLMINGVEFARGEVLVISDFFALRVHAVSRPPSTQVLSARLNLEGKA